MTDQKKPVPAPRRKRRRTFEDDSVRLKLSLPQNTNADGFEYRWADGTGSRIAQLESRGYERVEGDASMTDEYSGVQRRIGDTKKGDTQTGVLMRIPTEYFTEDRAMMRKAALGPIEELRKTRGRVGRDVQESDFKGDFRISEGAA